MLRHTANLRQAATMAQSWRLQELLASCGPDDVVFSRRVPNRGASFFAWPGLSATDVAQGMLQMPDNLRTAHVVFGRPDVPLDLALDIDEKLPLGKEFRDTAKVRAYQRKCLEDSLLEIHKILGEKGEKIESQAVLLSPNLQKLSFHVHIKLVNKAFKDYVHLGAFVKTAIAPRVPKVDVQIYRQNGSLRLFQSKKEDNTCAIVAYDDHYQINIPKVGADGAEITETVTASSSPSSKPKSGKRVQYRSAAAAEAAAQLQKKEVAASALSPQSLMLHSFIMRPKGTFTDYVSISSEDLDAARRSNTFFPSNVDGKPSTSNPLAPKMPLTVAEAILNAKHWISMLPEELAVHYSDWIKIGLYAFRIAQEYEDKFVEIYGNGKKPLPTGLTYESPSQELLKAWIEFSKRCPIKYRIGDCEQRWSTMRNTKSVPFFSAYRNLAALTQYGLPPPEK